MRWTFPIFKYDQFRISNQKCSVFKKKTCMTGTQMETLKDQVFGVNESPLSDFPK